MKQLLAIVSLVIVASSVLLGCSVSGEGDKGSQSGDQAFLTWATGTTGGAWYQVISAAVAVTQENSPNVQVQAQATGGSVENMRLLGQGAAQLGNTTPDTAYHGYIGEREFDKPIKSLRAVAAGNPQFEYIIVRADSDIQTVSDLEGKSISVGAPGSATEVMSSAILKSLGVENYQPERLEHSQAATAVSDGTVDAMMALSGIPYSAASELVATTDVRFIPLSDDDIKRVREDHPYWVKTQLPANTYEGQDEPVQGLDAPSIVVTSTDVPEDTIYELLRVLYLDHHKNWVEADKRAGGYSIEHTQELLEKHTFLVPFHPGAKKFLEEQGVKIPKKLASGPDSAGSNGS